MPGFLVNAMRSVAERLDRLGLDHTFSGGSVISLLLDHPELVSIRPTLDVDVVIQATTAAMSVSPRCYRMKDERGFFSLLLSATSPRSEVSAAIES